METQQVTPSGRTEPSPQSAAAPWTALLAGGCWLLTAIVGANDARVDDGEWESAYLLYSTFLMLAAVFTLVTVLLNPQPSRLRGLWIAGTAVGVLGLLSAVVAWALPLWMVTIAVGYLLLAAADQDRPGPLLALAGAQFAGLIVTIVAIEAETGPADSYGDYPYASAWGIATTALLTCAALRWLVAIGRRSAITDRP